jgi:hypothetical protein
VRVRAVVVTAVIERADPKRIERAFECSWN